MSSRASSTTRTVRQDRLPFPLGAIWSAAVTSKQAGEVHRATENVLRFIGALLLTDVLDLEWPAPVAELLSGGPERRGLEKLAMGSRVGLVRELVMLHASAPEDGPPRVLPPLSDWWEEVAPLLTASVEARNRDAHGMVAQQETDAALDRLATVLRRSRWLGEVQLVLATATEQGSRVTRGEVQRLVGVSPFDDLRCRFEATWRVRFAHGFVHLGSGDGMRWALCPFLLPGPRELGILDGISRRGALRFGNPLGAADTPVADGRGLPDAEDNAVDWYAFLAQRAELAPGYRVVEERPHANLCLPVPPAKQLAEGMVLDGDYRLVRPLGEGGMAVVWEVEGVHTGARHALKIPRAEVADTEFEVRFRREIDLLRRLHAEGVRRVLGPVERIVLEVGEERLTVLRMPVLRETLADRLRAAGGALPEVHVLAWGEQVLEALVDLHAKGVVHRDIKPSNLLLDADDAIVLADFGIARDGRAEARLTRTMARMGSELYMAPEQLHAARTVTGKADVFSLAVTLHELATGRTSPTPGKGLSGLLAEWLPRMAARDADERPDAKDVHFVFSASFLRVAARSSHKWPEAGEVPQAWHDAPNVISYEEVPRAGAAATHPTGLDLETLPFPVAHPLAFARDASLGVTERVNNAVFAAYQALKNAGLLMLADYLDIQTSEPALEGAIRGLRIPHWGEWTDLANKLALFWSEGASSKPDRPSRFASLVAGWRAVAMERASVHHRSLIEGLPGMQGPARTLNDALWKLRNDRAHRMATHTPGSSEEEQRLTRVLPIVEALCASLFPPGAFALVRRVGTDPLRVIRVHGPHPTLEFVPETLDEAWAGAFDATEVAALVGDTALSVYPLFAPDDDAEGRRPEVVTLIDGVKRHSLVLLGVQSHGESERHLGPLTTALGRKQVDLGLGREQATRWNLASWSRTFAREEVAALAGKKYFPACYVEREGVDRYAVEAMERGGRAVMLCGEAGSGKSSMLTRLVDRLTVDESPAASAKRSTLEAYLSTRGGGDVVLYLTGRAAYDGDAAATGAQLLMEAVLRRAGVRTGSFRDLRDFFAKLHESSAADDVRDRRVWIVLDAINECSRFADLVTAIDDILPSVEAYPWLRLVMSCRTGAWASLERRSREMSRFGAVFANEGHLARFADPMTKRDEPWMNVRPFDTRREGPLAYRLRAEAIPERACPQEWSALSPAVQELLLNPLHLHVFHETFAQRGDVGTEPDMDAGDLLSAYLDRLVSEMEALGETLTAVGEYLVKHRTPALPAEVVDGWLAEWRRRQGFTSANLVVKLDPVEELVSASILMRPANEGFGVDRRLVAFTFSHQRLCEQVIARALLQRIAPPGERRPAAKVLPSMSEWAAWTRHAMGRGGADVFPEGVGALAAIAAKFVEAGEGHAIASSLQLEDASTRGWLVGAALRAVGPVWGPTEDGSPRGRAVLDAIRSACIAEGTLAERLESATSGAREWLGHSGYSYVQARIEQVIVEVLRPVVARQPERLDLALDLSVSLNALCVLARRVGRREAALAYTREAHAIQSSIVHERNDGPITLNAQRLLAATFTDLGHLALDAGDPGTATRHYEAGFAIRRELFTAYPDNPDYGFALCVSLRHLSGRSHDAGRADEAHERAREALDIQRALVEKHPGRQDLKFWLTFSLVEVGLLMKDAGRLDLARESFHEALVLRRDLVAAEPHRLDRRSSLAYLLQQLGELEMDQTHLSEALDLQQSLVEAEPGHLGRADTLVQILKSLASIARNTGQLAEAEGYEALIASTQKHASAGPTTDDRWEELSVPVAGTAGW